MLWHVNRAEVSSLCACAGDSLAMVEASMGNATPARSGKNEE